MTKPGFDTFGRKYEPNRVDNGCLDGKPVRERQSFVHVLFESLKKRDGTTQEIEMLESLLLSLASDSKSDARVGPFHTCRIAHAIGAQPNSTIGVGFGALLQMEPSVETEVFEKEDLRFINAIAKLPLLIAETLSVSNGDIRSYAPNTIQFDEE